MSPRSHVCRHCLLALRPVRLQHQTQILPSIIAATNTSSTIPSTSASLYTRNNNVRHASTAHAHAHAHAITPAAPIEHIPRKATQAAPIVRHPPSQPPSHRPPEFRRSQLHRQYASLLRSMPMMLFFQHNNLRASEWVAVRRELTQALRKVDETRANDTRTPAGDLGIEAGAGQSQQQQEQSLAEAVKLQVIQGGVFGAALRVVEYYHPEQSQGQEAPQDTASTLPARALNHSSTSSRLTHGLSIAARDAAKAVAEEHPLEPLLTGPLAVLTFPAVSTEHLKAALSILAPSPPNFRAPTRRVNPGYYEQSVQLGLQKLMLLGARIEGKAFDLEGTKWVGTIEGGVAGLRAQLVAMLQGFGAGLTSTLETAGRSLYVTVEGRREMLEEEEKKKDTEKGE